MELALLPRTTSLLFCHFNSKTSFPEEGIVEKIMFSEKAGAILFASIFTASMSFEMANK